MPAYRPLADRFREKYTVSESGCWLWTAAKGPHGYGVIGVDARAIDTAHRVSWRLHKGEIPKGLLVCHTCDVRACVNPDHLYLGTYVDNARDMMERGAPFCWSLQQYMTPSVRAKAKAALPRGADHSRSGAKLTPDQVLAIYSAPGSQREIAARFGVCQQTVSLIKRRERWGYLHAD